MAPKAALPGTELPVLHLQPGDVATFLVTGEHDVLPRLPQFGTHGTEVGIAVRAVEADAAGSIARHVAAATPAPCCHGTT